MRDNSESNDQPLFLWPYARVLGPVLATPQVPIQARQLKMQLVAPALWPVAHTRAYSTRTVDQKRAGAAARGLRSLLVAASRPDAAKMRHGDQDRQRAERLSLAKISGSWGKAHPVAFPAACASCGSRDMARRRWWEHEDDDDTGSLLPRRS
jgi:hypothetical protein